jgi:hypothetical protein
MAGETEFAITFQPSVQQMTITGVVEEPQKVAGQR